MKIKSIVRTAVLGVALAFAALAGGAGQSEAAGFKGLSTLKVDAGQSQVHEVGNRRHRHRGFRKFKRFNGGGGHGHGCGYYKYKWHETGSFYWKKRYYICKGWW